MNELPITEGLGMKVRTFQVLCFIVAIGLVAPNAIVTANIDECLGDRASRVSI
jgi:hypothetical protein